MDCLAGSFGLDQLQKIYAVLSHGLQSAGRSVRSCGLTYMSAGWMAVISGNVGRGRGTRSHGSHSLANEPRIVYAAVPEGQVVHGSTTGFLRPRLKAGTRSLLLHPIGLSKS